jgi:hypothetical protein
MGDSIHQKPRNCIVAQERRLVLFFKTRENLPIWAQETVEEAASQCGARWLAAIIR